MYVGLQVPTTTTTTTLLKFQKVRLDCLWSPKKNASPWRHWNSVCSLFQKGVYHLMLPNVMKPSDVCWKDLCKLPCPTNKPEQGSHLGNVRKKYMELYRIKIDTYFLDCIPWLCGIPSNSNIHHVPMFFSKTTKANSSIKTKTQGSLHYQPKQCTITREIPQNYHIFALFDYPRNGSHLMTPETRWRSSCGSRYIWCWNHVGNFQPPIDSFRRFNGAVDRGGLLVRWRTRWAPDRSL